MQFIKSLKGIGQGKDCLIIGGGTSVNDFDFTIAFDMTKIAVNDAFPDNVKIDYCIYRDNCFVPVLREKRLWEKATVIGYANALDKNCQYSFSASDCHPAADDDNTGMKALIMARNIMGYGNIYLIGFDFYTVNGVSHFYGDEVGHKKKYEYELNLQNHFNRLNDMLLQFEKIKNYQNIYNCNHKSKLTVFPFALPMENLKTA